MTPHVAPTGSPVDPHAPDPASGSDHAVDTELPAARPVPAGPVEAIRALLVAGDVLTLTGAGMSTASGIPDYRGPDGNRRVQPMQAAEFSRSLEGRRRYWARSFVGWPRFARAVPNASHRALARLSAAGCLEAVVTQNVDGLDLASGTSPVLELHGSLDRIVCLDCGARSTRRELQERLAAVNVDPGPFAGDLRPDGDIVVPADFERAFVLVSCEACGSDRLKPDVVFFGASADPAVVAEVFERLARSRALLVLGSSLQVMSGLRFVRRAVDLGLPVAVVTRGAVRREDLIDPALRVDALLGDVLPALADAVETGR